MSLIAESKQVRLIEEGRGDKVERAGSRRRETDRQQAVCCSECHSETQRDTLLIELFKSFFNLPINPILT